MQEDPAAESRLCVLIVEDERVVALDLQQTLEGLGYDAYAIASSAADAMARATERRPDVALMDIRIKGDVDGVAAAEELRTQFGVPVIYLTAHADEATLDRAKETHPIGYLLKPVRVAELRSTIEVGYLRHLADARLRERERWISTILRSVTEGIVAVDEHERVVFVNPGGSRLAGRSELQAVGRPVDQVLELLGGDDRPIRPTPLSVALREQRAVVAQEARLKLEGGERVLVFAEAAPVLDEGRCLGAVLTVRDVTEERRLEQRLQLGDRLASMGRMAAAVAHELNNPLAVVLANAEFVLQALRASRPDVPPASEDAAPPSEAQRAVEDIAGAARRMGRIVRDLRVFSRPTQDGVPSADVGKAVEWALRMADAPVRERAQIRCELDPTPPVPLDETRLGQVLVNLLTNAAQAIPPGRAGDNLVAVRAYTNQAGGATIEVSDTGSGITPAALQRLFEPFFTTKGASGGTGLGLSICHGIVRGAGGEITVEPREGGGTTFRVDLPAASVARAGGDAGSASAPVRPPAPLPVRPRVLIIDDDTMVLRATTRMLVDAYDVVALGDVREALARIRAGERFDAIVCDLSMPDLSGRAFREALREAAPEVMERVLILTGGPRTPEDEAFVAQVGSLQKPVSMTELRAAIEKIIAGGKG